MAALLLAATGVSAGLAVRAHRAEVRAREQAATARNVSDFLWRELLKRLTPWSHTNAGVSLREAFESAAGRIDYRLSRQPLAEASVRFVFGKTYAGLWEYAAAESNLIRAVELQRRHGGAPDEPLAEFLSQLAELRVHQGRLAQAEPLYREAADIFARRLGDTHRDAVSAAAKLASVQARRLPPAEAEPLLRHHLERTTRFVAADHYVARQTLNQLGELRRDAGNLDAAHDLFAQAHRLTVTEEGEFSAGAMWGLELMAQARARQRQYAEAEQMLRHVVATRARTISPDHPRRAREPEAADPRRAPAATPLRRRRAVAAGGGGDGPAHACRFPSRAGCRPGGGSGGVARRGRRARVRALRAAGGRAPRRCDEGGLRARAGRSLNRRESAHSHRVRSP
ncbi:MAG: tetratricopeptide repeat protein [Verrucomicrobia bacterium]|nr:tetratricopeptide repeat protein [Verrucomicrobiota bacterium]